MTTIVALEQKINALSATPLSNAIKMLIPISGDQRIHNMFDADRQFFRETIGRKSRGYDATTYFAEACIHIGKYAAIAGLAYKLLF